MSSLENPDRNFLKRAANAPYLEKDHELELARRWLEKNDQQALHELTSAHMRLVISIAMKFKGYGLSTNDMIQEGHIGLLEAASRFEPERELRFSTYATWWIRASMQDYILRNWSIVRGGTSSNQKALFFKLRRLRAEIARNGKASNSFEMHQQLSQALGVSPKDVAVMDARFGGDISLNQTVATEEDTGTERQDFLVSEEALPDTNTFEMIDTPRKTKWLSQALDILDERELKIIKARKLTEKSDTLENLGVSLGVSKERVRQIEARALEKLKVELIRIVPDAEKLMSPNENLI